MSKLKVEQNFTVHGRVVEKVAEFLGLAVFLDRIDSETHKYYFTKNREVCKTMQVEAGYGQGGAYLCDGEFSDS